MVYIIVYMLVITREALKMNFITVSELRLKATQVISEIDKTKDDVIVTKNGKPVVLMRPVDEGEFELKTKKKGV